MFACEYQLFRHKLGELSVFVLNYCKKRTFLSGLVRFTFCRSSCSSHLVLSSSFLSNNFEGQLSEFEKMPEKVCKQMLQAFYWQHYFPPVTIGKDRERINE